MVKFYLDVGGDNMIKGKSIHKDHMKLLENIKNPTVREVIKLSDELKIEIEVLAKYFIDKESVK